MKTANNTPVYHALDNGQYYVVGNRNSAGRPYFGLLQKVAGDAHRFGKLVEIEGVQYGVTLTRQLALPDSETARIEKAARFMTWVVDMITRVAPAGTLLEYAPSRAYFFAVLPANVQPVKTAPFALQTVLFQVQTSFGSLVFHAN